MLCGGARCQESGTDQTGCGRWACSQSKAAQDRTDISWKAGSHVRKSGDGLVGVGGRRHRKPPAGWPRGQTHPTARPPLTSGQQLRLQQSLTRTKLQKQKINHLQLNFWREDSFLPRSGLFHHLEKFAKWERCAVPFFLRGTSATLAASMIRSPTGTSGLALGNRNSPSVRAKMLKVCNLLPHRI